ncbi:MAG TPA: helix-turn-helix transcriptional regulator [Streptosporangiaceae bacterium]|nr:helix-turn-helix transcriptional regulator [Streptosporangiaceae bacterium]
MDQPDRAELASFLRLWRGRLQPGDVGLDAGPRRRTPGLRRQEVAQLAGMSVDYYTRLEQGRGPRPSQQVILALGRALRLQSDELAHLHYLAGQVPQLPPRPESEVRPGLLRLLDRLDDTPALICDAKYDVLAWNAMATALLGNFAALPPDGRNVIWRFFTHPAARARYDEAGARQFARGSVADLRAAAARYPRDAGIRQLVTRLQQASPDFAALWAQRDVRVRRSTCKRLCHPALGWLELDCDALHDPDRDQWLILYTAAPGTPSHDALRELRRAAATPLESRA